MQLSRLLERDVEADVEVTGITSDSRKVANGDLFIAYRGSEYDAHEYVHEAFERGAVAVLAEKEPTNPVPVPWIVDPNAAKLRSLIAARYYSNPSRSLNCIGITGTNGKTSIAYGLAGLLDSTAFAGSLGWGVLPYLCETGLTTIDAISLQGALRHVLVNGVRNVAMEVSSHALEQGRVDDVDFRVAVFTNLTRDHMDFHGSMDSYGRAKARLFEKPTLDLAVLNADDDFSSTLQELLKRNRVATVTYGGQNDADISWTLMKHDIDGVHGVWHTPWGDHDFEIPVYGERYIANSAAILAVLRYFEVSLDDVCERMRYLQMPPGRMEFICVEDRPTVVIDYAHTPEALQVALSTLEELPKQDLWCVFGCGGDRDKGKRPLMAQIAEKHADHIIVTSDNPRYENPTEITEDITTGFASADQVQQYLDRQDAIEAAIDGAVPGDIVLIAGKGDEHTQEVMGCRQPFSDRLVVKKHLGVVE